MGVKVTGIDTLAVELRQTGPRAVKGVAAEMREIALEIQEEARKRAPLEYGNLENAIKIEEYQGSDRRKTFEVYVDENEPVPERPGETVGRYALRMHEGFYRLGRLSRAKQAGQTERVGPGFLTRAVKFVQRSVVARLNERLRRL